MIRRWCSGADDLRRQPAAPARQAARLGPSLHDGLRGQSRPEASPVSRVTARLLGAHRVGARPAQQPLTLAAAGGPLIAADRQDAAHAADQRLRRDVERDAPGGPAGQRCLEQVLDLPDEPLARQPDPRPASASERQQQQPVWRGELIGVEHRAEYRAGLLLPRGLLRSLAQPAHHPLGEVPVGGQEAVFLVGEVLVEAAARDVGARDRLGDARLAVAVAADGAEHPAHNTLARSVAALGLRPSRGSAVQRGGRVVARRLAHSRRVGSATPLFGYASVRRVWLFAAASLINGREDLARERPPQRRIPVARLFSEASGRRACSCHKQIRIHCALLPESYPARSDSARGRAGRCRHRWGRSRFARAHGPPPPGLRLPRCSRRTFGVSTPTCAALRLTGLHSTPDDKETQCSHAYAPASPTPTWWPPWRSSSH